MKWAVAEGGAKTISRLLQKFVGVASGSVAGAFMTTMVIGAIQVMGGFTGGQWRKAAIVVTPLQIFMAVLFGINATVMTVLGVVSFTYPGADVGITTFIVTMGIIPGAFIDWVFFRHPLNVRQWFGVVTFLLAGYAMLDFPPVVVLLALPPWVLLTFGIALFGAINEGITQWQGRRKINPLDPLANNFWIGLTTLLACAIGLTLIGGWRGGRFFPGKFWVGSAIIGVVTLGMISFKLLAYRGGGSIALKKLIMQATYLITATILGWITYAEPLTAGKILGMAGYVVAFTLMDRGTWEFVSDQLFFKRVPYSRY